MRWMILPSVLFCSMIAAGSVTRKIEPGSTKWSETVVANASQKGDSKDDYHIIVPSGYKAVVEFECTEYENVDKTATSCSAVIWQEGGDESEISSDTAKTYELQSDSHIYVEVSAKAGTHEVVKTRYNSVTKLWEWYTVIETYENYCFTITYTLAVTYERLVPDLAIEQLKVSPPIAAKDEEVTLSYVVKNNGGVKSGETTSSAYDGDAKLDSDHSVPELAAGGSHNVQLILKSQTVGNHSIKVRVGAVSGEVVTDNNESTVNLRRYARVPVDVKFDAQGGVGGETRKILAGDAIGKFPSVQKEGYTLTGWSSAPSALSPVTKETRIYEATTVYAIWRKTKELKICFDANGGQGNIGDLTVKEEGFVKLPDSGYERGGSALVGWSTSKGYNCVMLFSGAEIVVSHRDGSWYGQIAGSNGDPVRIGGTVEEITLYAVWGSEAYRHAVGSTVNATNLLFMTSSPARWSECDVSGKPMGSVNGASGCTSAFQSDPELDAYYYTVTTNQYGSKRYGGTNWLGAVVYGPGKLSYSPGTSCNSSGSISFAIDGDCVSVIKGQGAYTPSYGIAWLPRESYDIPEGRHFVCWCFVAENMMALSSSYNCVWAGDIKWERESSNDFTIRYRCTAASTSFFDQRVKCDAVSSLLNMKSMCGWMPGKKIAGWQCSNGKRYDDGVLVFNLAKPGETVTMTAIWEDIPVDVSTLSRGLVAHYPLNGNAKDVSVYGNHGTVNGATATTDRHGNANSAMYFDGKSWICAPGIPAIAGLSKSVTVSAWVKFDTDSTAYNWYVLCRGEASCSLGLCAYNMNLASWSLDGKSDLMLTGMTAPSLGQWTHVAMTLGDGVLSLYLGGKLADSQDVADDASLPAIGDAPLYIGKDPPGNVEYCKGALDDIRIYNRALSDKEISALARQE